MEKVLFVISAMGHGKGGHFHSLNHISREIGKNNNDVRIISIGTGFSPVISKNPYFLTHLELSGLKIFELKKASILISGFSPRIIHFFDVRSYLLFKVLLGNNYKYVLNKCGGPAPNKFFPYIKNIVLFSQEDYHWFQSYRPYKNSNIYLIPNRVQSINIKNKDIQLVKDENLFTFIITARIGIKYKEIIAGAIRLVNRLKWDYKISVKLIIIGAIQCQKTYKYITSLCRCDDNIEIFTDNKYTQEASNFLYLADAVIGTGRSIMEGASLKLPILSADKNGDIPVLLNELTFNDAFITNFSERNSFTKKGQNINDIISMINEPSKYKELSLFAYQMFLSKFDLSNSIDQYQKVYKNADYNESFKNRNIYRLIKLYIRSMKELNTVKNP